MTHKVPLTGESIENLEQWWAAQIGPQPQKFDWAGWLYPALCLIMAGVVIWWAFR